MDSQIRAVRKMGPRPLTRSETFQWEIDLHFPGEITHIGRPSRKRDDLVFSDTCCVVYESDTAENDRISMFFQQFACSAEATTPFL